MNPIEIRLPEITAGTEAQQLQQIRSYLYTLAQQLQYAFDSQTESVYIKQERTKTETDRQTAQENFAAIKSLILRSADIVEQYSQKIEQRLSGKYLAQSQFGTYRQETDLRLEANSQRITQEYQNLQRLQTQVETVLEIGASIRTGALYEKQDGTTVYGLEIGQQEWQNGVRIFRRFCRLSADRLSFYDSNDTEVAYISDSCMHVTSASLKDLQAETGAFRQIAFGEYLLQYHPNGHLTFT